MNKIVCPLRTEFEEYLLSTNTSDGKREGAAQSYPSNVSSVLSKYVAEDKVAELCGLIEKQRKLSKVQNETLVETLNEIVLDVAEAVLTSPKKKTLQNCISGFKAYIGFLSYRFKLSITPDKLTAKFKLRIKTQDRTTSDPTAFPCFPIRLILWAARIIDKQAYRKIMAAVEYAADNVHIITSNGVIHASNVELLELGKGNTVWAKVDGRSYQVFTATADKQVVPMHARKDEINDCVSYMHLDHFTPISSIIKNHHGLNSLMKLTGYMESYAKEHGLPFNTSPKDFQKLVAAMKNDRDSVIPHIEPLLSGLVQETCELLQSTTFTLMDAKENIKKSNGEHLS